MNYSLRIYLVWSDYLTCEYYKVEERENIDIRKHVKRYNQAVDKTDIQMEIFFHKIGVGIRLMR
jgi:hypothetical protein